MEIREEYEKICPMTTWSDKELLDFLHKQKLTTFKENPESTIEIIHVDSIDKYVNENNCKYAEEVLYGLRRNEPASAPND